MEPWHTHPVVGMGQTDQLGDQRSYVDPCEMTRTAGRTRRVCAAGPVQANARYRWEVAPAGSWSYVCVTPGSSYHEYA